MGGSQSEEDSVLVSGALDATAHSQSIPKDSGGRGGPGTDLRVGRMSEEGSAK